MRLGDDLTVSLFTLAEAVSPYVRSFRQQLDMATSHEQATSHGS